MKDAYQSDELKRRFHVRLDFKTFLGHSLLVNEKDQTGNGVNETTFQVELPRSHQQVLEKVRKMTPEEGFASLVASGIYTPEGQLTENYGGQGSRK